MQINSRSLPFATILAKITRTATFKHQFFARSQHKVRNIAYVRCRSRLLMFHISPFTFPPPLSSWRSAIQEKEREPSRNQSRQLDAGGQGTGERVKKKETASARARGDKRDEKRKQGEGEKCMGVNRAHRKVAGAPCAPLSSRWLAQLSVRWSVSKRAFHLQTARPASDTWPPSCYVNIGTSPQVFVRYFSERLVRRATTARELL